MRRVFRKENTAEKNARRKSLNEEGNKAKSNRINARRKSRAENDLTTSLMGNDALQMQQIGQQPKSFFGNDDEISESAASTAIETFESAGYSWDFVIVLPVSPPSDIQEPFLEPSEIVQLLHDGGLQTYLFKSVQEDEIICKVRASVDRLRDHAELLGYRLQYDEEEIRHMVEWGIPNTKSDGYRIKPVHIAHDKAITPLHPFEFIHGEYKSEIAHLFAKGDNLPHPFTSQHRIKLLMSIILQKGDGGCGLNLEELLKTGSILAHYPLHVDYRVQQLSACWLPWSIMPWEQPIDMIRDYFGEKIGMYFEFLGHYTTWLLPLSIVGVLVGIDVLIETILYGTYTKAIGKGYSIPLFCVFVAFWSQLMLEYWKRTEATKAMEWGMSNFEDIETERPYFEGELRTSHIDGKPIRFFPQEERTKRVRFSNNVILGMVLLVIGCVAVIFYVKFYMVEVSNDETANSYGSITASVANAIQIQILNVIYQDLAVYLTNNENHRTDTQYEDALIAKLFAFQFVNSYASFVYIAFIKTTIGDPCQGSCMSELSVALVTIFGIRLVVGNAQEVLVPLAMSWYRRRQESAAQSEETEFERERRLRAEANMSKAEAEYSLERYDSLMGSLEDYAELAIQYGYVTLFVAAFPLAPLLAFISNIVEIRTDGWKLLHAHRRPQPTGAQDIGTWMSILQLTSIIAVVTNAGIICFTMDVFDVTPQGKLWLFIGFQYTVFVAMAIFAYMVDDVPEEVSVQLSREQFLNAKINQIVLEIEDNDEATTKHAIMASMQINEADDETPFRKDTYNLPV